MTLDIFSWFLMITLVSATIHFKPDTATNIGKLQRLFESGVTVPRQRPVTALTIIPLDFPQKNHHEFVVFMETVYKYSTKSVLLLDKPVPKEPDGNYFFVLSYGNKLDKFRQAVGFMNAVSGMKSLLTWVGGTDQATRGLIGREVMKIAGLCEVVLIRATEPQDIEEADGAILLFIILNAALAKTKPTSLSEKIILVTPEDIEWGVSTVDRMLRIFNKRLSRAKQRILLFPRPISVEKDKFGRVQGVEVSMADLVCKLLGVSCKITLGRPEDFGRQYVNGSYMLPYKAIMGEMIDFSFNRYPVHEIHGTRFIPILSGSDKYCFIVRTPDHRVRVWGILGAFKPVAWTALCVAHICVFLMFVFLRVKTFSFMDVVQSRLSVTNFLPTQLSHRVFWISWLFFVLLTNNAFTSSFVKQLMGIDNLKRYRSLHDLTEANLTLLSEIGQFELRMPEVSTKVKPFFGGAHEIGERSALLTSRFTRIQLLKTYGQRFYKVDECVEDTFTSLLISSSHPLQRKISFVMQKIIGMGLHVALLSNYINEHVHFAPNGSRFFVHTTPMPLQLQELHAIFIWVLGVGLGSATIVFVCEIVYFQLYGKNH